MSDRSRRRFLLHAGAIATFGPALLRCAGTSQPAEAAPRPLAHAPLAAAAGPVFAATWEWGETVCTRASEVLGSGGSLLDAVEQGVNAVEVDPEVTSVGYGGLPNEKGVVELDAMIMEGSTLEAGAVASIQGVKTPISVARQVMAKTRHIYLVGPGAKAFAERMGLDTSADLLTDAARAKWEAWKAEGSPESFWRETADHDTVGVVGLDGKGEVVVGMSTSGLAWKLDGRVGDTPIVGAGGYADAEVGAACATGVGEEVIRTVGAFAVVEAMRRGLSPTEALQEVLKRLIRRRPGLVGDKQVAMIALRKDGAVGAACIRKGFEFALKRGEAPTERYAVEPLSG